MSLTLMLLEPVNALPTPPSWSGQWAKRAKVPTLHSLFSRNVEGPPALQLSSVLAGFTTGREASPEVHLSNELNLTSLEGPSSERHPCFLRAAPPQTGQERRVPAYNGASPMGRMEGACFWSHHCCRTVIFPLGN